MHTNGTIGGGQAVSIKEFQPNHSGFESIHC